MTKADARRAYRVVAAQKPEYRFCLRCGRELARFATMVREPNGNYTGEPFQRPYSQGWCIYEGHDEHGEVVR